MPAHRRPLVLAAVAALVAALFAPGAVAATGAQPLGDAAFDEATRSLSFRLVGPFRGGRSTAVAGVAGEPGTYYMGTTGGGVWKTTDYGVTWRNVSDLERPDPEAVAARPMGREAGGARAGAELAEDGTPEPRKVRRGGDPFGSASVGAIAVAPSDPNVVWVGMGSACIRGNTSAGDGVYRSTDGGDTWHHVGLPEAGQIGGLAVHPSDPDTAWVAALGHAFGANPERGVYRTRDGGATWENVLWVSEQAGAVDLALDPSNPRVLYAAFWQAVRKPWDMISGGPGSGLFKSTDGGDTWAELGEGLPEGIKGKIGVAVSPARPDRVWTLVEHAEKKGLYRSDDGGASFRLVSSDNNLMQRPWYYTHVYADPQDADTVYVLNVGMWKSIDGGESFRPIRTPHGDNHDLWIDPDDPRLMVEANDGGANVSTNGGRSWSSQANQPTAEMYRVAVDHQHPYWLYGGQQDNSTVAIPSRSMGRGIAREDWYAPGGCESGHVAIDPEDPNVTWAGCYGGTIERYDRATGHSQEVTPWPQLAVGQAPTDLDYRFQWNAPIRISPHDPDVLYHASNHVHRSTDGGHSWQTISPDLSHADPQVLVSAGGPISKDNTGVEVFGTVFALEESPQRAGLLWAGTDDGRVHVSEDGGGAWRDVTPPGMPQWGTVNMIAPSAHDAARAFVAVHRYRLDDFRPYVFRTDDLGATWVRVADGTRGIPERHFVRAVREDPEVRGLLYAGTEYGLYASFDDGASWRSLQLDLPVTPVTDLQVHRGDLVVATQGRSFWILDDLAVLRGLAESGLPSAPRLYPPADVVLYPGGGGGGQGEGRNPPAGALIRYHLPEDLSEDGAAEVTIEIVDSSGETIRTMSSQEAERRAPNPFAQYFPESVTPAKLKAERGLNAWEWDLALADAFLVDDAVLWGGAGGPEVPPGDYGVVLTVGDPADGGTVDEATLRVVQDPRLDLPPGAAAARYELSRRAHAALSRLHHALADLRRVKEEAKAAAERVDPEGESEELQESLSALTEGLTEVEERITQTKSKAVQDVLNYPPQLDNQLVFLIGVVESAEGRPTAASVERWEELRGRVEGLMEELAGVLGDEGALGAFNGVVAAMEEGRVAVEGGGEDWR